MRSARVDSCGRCLWGAYCTLISPDRAVDQIRKLLKKLAGSTRLELATSAVTVQRFAVTN
jgi:hypothetical protein